MSLVKGKTDNFRQLFTFLILAEIIYIQENIWYNVKTQKGGLFMYIIPIYMYSVLALLLPVIFRLINPKLTFYSIVCAIIIELVVYWDEFCYYEGRPFMILFTIIQILVMIIISVILSVAGKKKANK